MAEPHRPARAPELVGHPNERGRREDVSGWELRPIVVRALDEVLKTRTDLHNMAKGLQLDLEDKEHRLTALERDRAEREKMSSSSPPPMPTVPPYRDPEQSYHDFDPAVKALRNSIAKRVKDKSDPLDTKKAIDFVLQVEHAVEDRKELDTWRFIKSLPGKAVEHWVIALLAGALGLGGSALAHWLLSALHLSH